MTANRPAIRIDWNSVPWEIYDQNLSTRTPAYQQDWAYAATLITPTKSVDMVTAYIHRDDGSYVGQALFMVRRFAMIVRVAVCSYGPVWGDNVTPAEKIESYRRLRKDIPLGWPRLAIFTPDEAEGEAAGLKGMRRVMTGDATVLIDLRKSEDDLRAAMEPSWRNKVSKAERAGLVVQKTGAKPAQYRWLLDAEAKQRQKRGYRAMPLELTELWQSHKAYIAKGDKNAGLVVYRIDSGRDPAAAMLFLIHGRRATYHVGWTSEDGRKMSAHNLILWHAMKDLKARGIELLDLGGVNTQSGAGIARFKLETGGTVLKRAGSYV